MKEIYKTLSQVNVNDLTEQRNGLTYLSWARAWGKLLEYYPNSSYKVTKYGEMQLPYVYDERLGYMCHTTITVNGITQEMWLPVMDSANNAMKSAAYTYQVWDKYSKSWKEKTVASATMFDINKTIMRCLAKNIAMFGLGLYIYAGEDLPMQLDSQEETPAPKAETAQPTRGRYYNEYLDLAIKSVEVCKDLTTLGQIYKDNPHFHNEQTFMASCTKKKQELKNA